MMHFKNPAQSLAHGGYSHRSPGEPFSCHPVHDRNASGSHSLHHTTATYFISQLGKIQVSLIYLN